MKTLDMLWFSPSANFVLSKDEVHLWRASLNQPTSLVQQLAQTLSVNEQVRADRFCFEKDRWHFIVSRGLLRTILSRYLGMEPSQLQFYYGAHNKPALAATSSSSTLQFNLSHSHELALYAVTCDREIGIDLEHIRPISNTEQIAQRFFSDREYAVLCTLPQSQKQAAFFNCWTRKEAYIKATGRGLSLPLNQFEVSLTPGEPAALLGTLGEPQEASRWSLRELTPDPEYVAALAVEGNGWQLQCFQWSS